MFFALQDFRQNYVTYIYSPPVLVLCACLSRITVMTLDEEYKL
jgi:hypothetical protein